MRWKSMTIGIVAALLATAPAARAADYTVSGTTDAAGSCTGFDCPTIRAALAAVSAGDQITLPAGAYQVDSPLVVSTAVTLTGANARTTSIAASNPTRVLDITADASLLHMTISGGTAANDFGGNIRVQRATVSLDRVRVTGGEAGTGGGIANVSGTLVVTNSLIDGNVAEFTGGPGDISEGAGGGIANTGDALGSAGLTLRNTTLAKNTAARGGAVASFGDPGNSLTLENATIARNQTGPGGGAGTFIQGGQFTSGSSIIAANTLVAGGSLDNCAGTTPKATSSGWNVEDADQCLLRQEPDRVVADAGLRSDLDGLGGETDVLLPAVDSPAVNIKAPGDCLPLDQRGIARPQGPACDAGAVELDYAVRIDSGPLGRTNETSPNFTFSSSTPSATFECALDTPTVPAGTFAACPSAYSLDDAVDGTYTFHVRLAGQPASEVQRTFTIDTTAPIVSIAGPRPTNATSATVTFTASEPDVSYTCRVTPPHPVGDPQPAACTSPWTFATPDEGDYLVEVSASDGLNAGQYANATVVVDRTAPAAVVPAEPETGSFSFTGGENDGSFACRLDGPSGNGAFAPCTSPQAYPNLPAGDYAFTLRTVDAAGNHADAAARTFSIAAPPEPTVVPVPAPAPAPVVTPIAVAPPAPTPQAGETVVVRPSSGKVFVRPPGSSQFAELPRSTGIPLGSEIDTRKGKVVLTAESIDGQPVERATFYGGLFIVRQVGPYIELTLSEQLASCKKKAKASAAAAKPKTRKLWGDGKGKFRTKGQYSAATVRGTKWLVQDSCDGTLTRVAQGLVSVRDIPKRKTVLVRASRSYLAKPKR